jgi:uncharacterized protein (TIGR02145 family)
MDPRLIAPDGFHIPTLEEWPVLNTYLSTQSQSMAALKNISLDVWTFPNGSASNAYLFEAMPGGAILYNGSGYNMNGWGYYWMYTQGGNSPDDGRPRYAYFGYNGSAAPDAFYTFLGQGMSVRIISNDSLVRGQLFGGGILLENTGTEGITGYQDGGSPYIGSDIWGCSGIIIGATDGQDGHTNTQLMAINFCNTLSDKLTNGVVSYNEYRDWYVPASDEALRQIQQVPEYEALLDPTQAYWTSTEMDNFTAFTIINPSNTPGGGNWILKQSNKSIGLPFLGMRRQQL